MQGNIDTWLFLNKNLIMDLHLAFILLVRLYDVSCFNLMFQHWWEVGMQFLVMDATS